MLFKAKKTPAAVAPDVPAPQPTIPSQPAATKRPSVSRVSRDEAGAPPLTPAAATAPTGPKVTFGTPQEQQQHAAVGEQLQTARTAPVTPATAAAPKTPPASVLAEQERRKTKLAVEGLRFKRQKLSGEQQLARDKQQAEMQPPPASVLAEEARRKTRLATEGMRFHQQKLSGEQQLARDKQQQQHKLELEGARAGTVRAKGSVDAANIEAKRRSNAEFQQRQHEQMLGREQRQEERRQQRAADAQQRKEEKFKAKVDGPAYQSPHPGAPATPLSDAAIAALRRHRISLRPQTTGEKLKNAGQRKQTFFTPELEERHPLDVLDDDSKPWLDHSARRILEDYDVGFRDYSPREKLANRWKVAKYGLPQNYYGERKAVLTPRQAPVQVDYDNRAETGLGPLDTPSTQQRVDADHQINRHIASGRHRPPRIGHRLPFLFRKFGG